jgi:alpha-galactosidase
VTDAEFDPSTSTWLLSTPATSYALRLVGTGSVRHVYWGPRLTLAQAALVPATADGNDDVLGEELPGEGGQRFGPPALRVEFADGTRAVRWRYTGHTLDGGHLRLVLADRHYPLELELHYRVWPDSDVIERWTVLANTGPADPIVVERAGSAAWTLPARPDYRLSQVAGEWSAEFQLSRATVARGETTLTSRRGVTRHQGNPWVMIDAGDAGEERGEVWSAVLAWGGTWALTVRRNLGDHLALIGGAGHDGLRRSLRPGERWQAPVFAGLYAADGFGGTSRRWHGYARGHVLPAPDELRPVLFNSWEGTWFDVDQDNQAELAGIAADLGVELFVMDDGWFGGRTSDRAGLGDWWPNPDRFPDGLGPLIARVRGLGMRFGLWVEPEMVNPDSDLYRAHPDWVLHMPHRDRTELRHQLVLNLARRDVADWAHDWLDRLLAGHDIDFLKWDMNRAFTEAGWPGAEDPGRLYVDHTTAVHRLLDRLRADHPHVRIETCASGGGRVDHGILARTDQAWASDNTDPVDRIAIQHGFGQVYPAITMGAWASGDPNPLTGRRAPLRFRFHVAMAGVLGISGNLREWTAAERAEAAGLVAAYKRIRPVVQRGRLYRLTPPATDRLTAVQYVSEDGTESVVLAWRALARFARPDPPLRLGGLDPAARYRDEETGDEHLGGVLTHHGLVPPLPPGDLSSTMIHLRRTG